MQELRTSERTTWYNCPQQWWWSYVEELTPKRPPTALWFGAHWHDALAGWYQKGTARGQHPAEYLDKAITQDRKVYVTTEEEEDSFVKAHDLAVAMGEGYVAEYGKDEQWEILATEADFAVIFKKAGVDYLRYLFCMDGVYRDLDTGQLMILEHKTAKAIKTKHLRLDNQAGSYYALAPIVLEEDLGQKIRGIQYNFARKAIPDDKPRDRNGQVTNKPTKLHYFNALKGKNIAIAGVEYTDVKLSRMSLDALDELARAVLAKPVLGDVSKTQPAPFFLRPTPVFRTQEERATQIARIRHDAHYMRQMREGNPDFPVDKTPGNHCSWCPFRDMCELDEYNKDAAQSFKEVWMTIRDPYEQYRKVA